MNNRALHQEVICGSPPITPHADSLKWSHGQPEAVEQHKERKNYFLGGGAGLWKKGGMLRRRTTDKDAEQGTQGSFHSCA